MELMRVATFASIDQMVNQALRAQAVMNSEQEQESSGLVSSDYGGYGAQAGQVLNLQISLARSQSFSAAASAADERAQDGDLRADLGSDFPWGGSDIRGGDAMNSLVFSMI